MKVLITTQVVNPDHPILGFMHGWLAAFAKQFSEVHVICFETANHTLPPNVFVYSLGKEAGASKLLQLLRFYRYFIQIFFRVRVDYVFFHMGAIKNILAAPFFLVRRLFSTQFYWWKAHGRINRFGRLALFFVDRVYTSTASGFPIETKKRHIIGQAIDTTQFSPDLAVEREPLLIFVGRISTIKHIETFLETYQQLKATGYNFTATIIGPISDEVYYRKLLEKCDALAIPRSIFAGPATQAELVGWYRRATYFLNTSLTHSMDKTVLEAILCGCIPVTGNQAFADLLAPHGLYIERATVADYRQAIQKLSETDHAELQQSLQSKVRQLHSLDTFAERIFGLAQ